MELVLLKDLEIISAMVPLMGHRKNGTEYGEYDDLFDGISLRIDNGTETLMVK